ncbi:multiprotein-bridging factor 1 family protein [Dactylosporangium sp. NPDC051541]|uniref:multiprotein-bridging factor 1 family protein n=1 Tax=Dactylosporangium sp. NPDC051541 TaxID=3363977 RepID=UPI0037B657E0
MDSTAPSAFWDDLADDLTDTEFLRHYIVETMRITTVDHVVNALDDARMVAGLSKAEVARAIAAQPSVVRRLFAEGHSNPTLGTLAAVAAVLGMRVTLEPLPPAVVDCVTAPLLAGEAVDAQATAACLLELRHTHSDRSTTAA